MTGWFRKISFATVLLFCLASCSYRNEGVRILDDAQARLDNHPDSAFVALDSLDRRYLNTKELRARHALLYSIALEKVGIEVMDDSIINIALDYYKKSGDTANEAAARMWKARIMSEKPSMTDTLALQNARIIKERYSDKMALEVNRQNTLLLVVISMVIIAVCVMIIRRMNRKIGGLPDEKTMGVIRERLAVLDKVLASHISSDEKAWKVSEDELDNLMSDRETFLMSTTVVFKESHPEFISYLQEKGLTDWETGYCCLYTLGLKGKDIGKFIMKKRHYIISSDIRSKLGLGEHDTNIGIYLRNLLSSLENRRM